MMTRAFQSCLLGSRLRRTTRGGVGLGFIGLGLGLRLLGADVEVTATVEGRGMVLGTGTYAAGVPVTLRAVPQAGAAATKDPVVSNVRAAQRPSSRLVDIDYDVADADSPTVTIYLKVSADGGATWSGPLDSVTGHVGRGILPGPGKRLTWDAGKDFPNQYGRRFRFRVGASDVWMAPANMVLIPAGPFQMGDVRVGNATPVHTVTVSAFAMDKWEVTKALWDQVRAWASGKGYDLPVGGSFGDGTHPVHSVNWYDAVKWCNARSEKAGLVPAYYMDTGMTQVYRSGVLDPTVNWDTGYRLPTEGEWEKGARGGVAGKLYPWGTDDINPGQARYASGGVSGTVPVGTYAPNGYGLYDMAGSLWEWCWDGWGGYSGDAQTDPRGRSAGSRPVLRGGSWFSDGGSCTSASRYGDDPFYRIDKSGFRAVLAPGQP